MLWMHAQECAHSYACIHIIYNNTDWCYGSVMIDQWCQWYHTLSSMVSLLWSVVSVVSYLVINGVKLCQQYPIDGPGASLLRVVHQGSVELDELVNGFIANQSLTDKQDKVGSVHTDELWTIVWACVCVSAWLMSYVDTNNMYLCTHTIV